MANNPVYDPEPGEAAAKKPRSEALDDLSDKERRNLLNAERAGLFKNDQDFENKRRVSPHGLAKKEVDNADRAKATELAGANQKGKVRGFFARNKKKTVIGSVVGVLAGGGIFAGTLLVGPFQIMHLAQTLQDTHLQRNSDVSDDRSSRALLYALAGRAEMGRLGIVGNKAADSYEKKLLKETGMRPAYNQSGRLIGFEIVDEDKANRTLGTDDRNGDKLERLAGKGAEIRSASDIQNSGTIRNRNGPVRNNPRILDLSDVNFRDRRVMTKTLGKITNINGISSAAGSRLLIKRGGVDFHPMNGVKRKADETVGKFRERRQQEIDREVTNGADPLDAPRAQAEAVDRDGDNVAETNPEDEKAAKDANDLIDSAKNADQKGLKAIQGNLTKLAGPAVVVGLLCAAQAYGDQIPEQAHKENLKMMRMAGRIIAVGSQLKMGQDVSLDELGVVSDALYDEETKTSWTQALAIQAGNNEELDGTDIPKEAKPAPPNDKPAAFKAIDSLNAVGLNQACKVTGLLSKIPVLSNISNFVSKIGTAAVDGVLKAAGFASTAELSASLLSNLAGKSVNTSAQGAEFGNYVGYGARIMANDQAISTGGTALSNSQKLAFEAWHETYYGQEDRGFTARYLDPTVASSLVGSTIDTLPSNFSQVGLSIASYPSYFASLPSSLFGLVTPKAAAATEYDWGFPMYGFTAEELDNEKYEDPYTNAAYVEPRLTELNSKYGDCFATKIIPTGNDGIQVETGESVNYTNLSNNDNCKTTNKNPSELEDFTRFRFYLIDTISVKGLACYEGVDDAACTELGIGGGQSPSSTTSSGGLGVGENGFTFPLQTTKSQIANDKPAHWFFDRETSYHHDYAAADIFTKTGTVVVAAVPGKVLTAKDSSKFPSRIGSRIVIKGTDGNIYYYAHMGVNTLKVTDGQDVTAGTPLGLIGVDADAAGTQRHLHFDILPPSYDSRPSCSGAECTQYDFIDPQKALITAYKNLPE